MKRGSEGEGMSRFRFSPGSVIFLTIFIDMTGFGMIIPLIPFFADTFQVGATGIGVLMASFSLMQFIFSPILGRVSDSVGRRPILLLSLLISCVSFILFTFADSFVILLLSRIIAGLATEITVARAYIADITSEEERTKGMGRIGAAFGAGIIVGPAIGGFLSIYGFWAPGSAAVALTLVNLVSVFLFLPESMTPSQRRVKVSVNSFTGIFRSLLHAFMVPLLGIVLVIYFLEEITHSTVAIIMPLLGIAFFDLQPFEMSYIFMYIGVIQILLQGVAMGRISRTLSDEKLVIVGLLLVVGGMLTLPFSPGIVFFLLLTAVMSSGMGILSTVIPSFISKKAPPREQGGVLGITHSVSSIARIFGPPLGGVMFDYAGVASPFFFNVCLLLGAVGLSVKVMKTENKMKVRT
nr:MFS transporter [Candidatus Aenigmarchaeota archaeon]